MQIALAPKDLIFRDEVRAFLDQEFTPELRAASARQAGVFAEGPIAKAWLSILHAKGWAAPTWPKAYGGAEFSPVQRFIFDAECAAAGTPTLPAMGLQMCGPVLMGHGTEAQKAYFLPRILSGEHYWCQGYSEPGAGSDLAGLQCRAVRDGDDYVINGTKIWTTHAHFANWMFLLVRTRTEGKPQAGISFLLVDMKTPGLTVQPIISISGEHEVNQVFFDNMRVPVANRVGDENQGWAVAKYLLEFERGGTFSGRIRGALTNLKRMAAMEQNDDGGCMTMDRDYARQLAEIEVQLLAMEYSERRVISQMASGGNVGDASASVMKLTGTELMQRVTELAIHVLGAYANPDQRQALGLGSNLAPIGHDYAITPSARYFNTRAATIYGGSSEVQRNILARTALGL
jgi:acyl-CoA dehydrogenase